MSVLIERLPKQKLAKPAITKNPFSKLFEWYMAYADRQAKLSMLWYMKVILIIPCVIMVPAIFFMAFATPNFVWFIGLSVLLFFSNIIAFISETESRFYIPLYHGTIAILFIIPLITLFLNIG